MEHQNKHTVEVDFLIPSIAFKNWNLMQMLIKMDYLTNIIRRDLYFQHLIRNWIIESSENADLSKAMNDTEMEIVESTEKISEDIYTVEEAKEEYRGFQVDSILHTQSDGDIHFNVYIPDDYDGSTPYALYITLPGYQGLYFQGAAQNIKTEEFGFEAQKYDDQMIIVAPQLLTV